MAEKGSPCVSRLGVATETTGVVKEWVAWETPNRCVFCWGSEGRGCHKALRCTPLSHPKKSTPTPPQAAPQAGPGAKQTLWGFLLTARSPPGRGF